MIARHRPTSPAFAFFPVPVSVWKASFGVAQPYASYSFLIRLLPDIRLR